MAKSRRSSRTKSRRSSSRKSKGKRGGRRMSKKSLGLFGRVYSPVNHLFMAAENSINSLARGTGSIARTGLNSVNKVGKSITRHADEAVRNVVSRKSRKSRKNRKNRKN
jgi:hypothetical protein